MRFKTIELIGLDLDRAVAKCEGHEGGRLHYSTDPSLAIPIFEREGIGIVRGGVYQDRFWRASRSHRGVYADGPTMLIAGFRCLVAIKLGDEFDMPDEVCS